LIDLKLIKSNDTSIFGPSDGAKMVQVMACRKIVCFTGSVNIQLVF